ncbi:MAG: hypothetical protein ACTSXP_13805 [Promethearchaeota archaeon]
MEKEEKITTLPAAQQVLEKWHPEKMILPPLSRKPVVPKFRKPCVVQKDECCSDVSELC